MKEAKVVWLILKDMGKLVVSVFGLPDMDEGNVFQFVGWILILIFGSVFAVIPANGSNPNHYERIAWQNTVAVMMVVWVLCNIIGYLNRKDSFLREYLKEKLEQVNTSENKETYLRSSSKPK